MLLKSDRPAQDIFGDPLPVMQVRGDIAIIPIVGRLLVNVPDGFKSYGFNMTDVNDIEIEIDSALNNSSVRIIVLNIDSPGGESIAGDKLFDLVEAANQKKPVLAFCGDGAQMCSSAYECAAAARVIYSGKYAQVGCIGSYLAFLDDTEYWKNLGFTWQVLRSGTFKGIGEDAITDEQIAWLQSQVEQAGAKFRANVSKYRTAIDPEDMEGQWFNGSEAAQRGFVAATVQNLDTAIAKFRQFV